jgi:hypothetical protein
LHQQQALRQVDQRQRRRQPAKLACWLLYSFFIITISFQFKCLDDTPTILLELKLYQ